MEVFLYQCLMMFCCSAAQATVQCPAVLDLIYFTPIELAAACTSDALAAGLPSRS